METFLADDGTVLAYHQDGAGAPLICVPGGPMQASAYLGDLGGLTAHRTLVRLDLRGTGDSAAPADESSYQVARQVADLEALRVSLGLDQLDLLGHSAGAAMAVSYAARFPTRVARLVLVTPTPRAVDLTVSDAARREVALLRSDAPWFPTAYAAFERIWAGSPSDEDWAAIVPFSYGRWDEAAQAVDAQQAAESNESAAEVYYSSFSPVSVDALDFLVLLLTGQLDVGLPPSVAVEYAKLFSGAELVVLDGCGHFPWLDDAAGFVTSVARFLP